MTKQEYIDLLRKNSLDKTIESSKIENCLDYRTLNDIQSIKSGNFDLDSLDFFSAENIFNEKVYFLAEIKEVVNNRDIYRIKMPSIKVSEGQKKLVFFDERILN